MIKYNNTNNASTTLTAWISASSTTLIVENGDILPTAPFLLTLEHFDNEKVTVREIVKCIAKAWNILTIQRGAWTCVQDDSATPKAQNNTPHSFSVWDVASIYWTSEQVQDIQNEIEKKLNIDDFQAWTYVYGATSTETDAYSITIPWTLTSYAVGQVFRFMADVDNEWNATLNINGLWAVEIRKNHDKILDNGDIEAWQIVEVAYDWTYFQMDSQVATVVDINNIGNTSTISSQIAWETLEENDVVMAWAGRFDSDWATESLDVWGTENNKLAIWFTSTWDDASRFKIKACLDEDNEPETITVNLETDDNWKPSWTVLQTADIKEYIRCIGTTLNATTALINVFGTSKPIIYPTDWTLASLTSIYWYWYWQIYNETVWSDAKISVNTPNWIKTITFEWVGSYSLCSNTCDWKFFVFKSWNNVKAFHCITPFSSVWMTITNGTIWNSIINVIDETHIFWFTPNWGTRAYGNFYILDNEYDVSSYTTQSRDSGAFYTTDWALITFKYDWISYVFFNFRDASGILHYETLSDITRDSIYNPIKDKNFFPFFWDNTYAVSPDGSVICLLWGLTKTFTEEEVLIPFTFSWLTAWTKYRLTFHPEISWMVVDSMKISYAEWEYSTPIMLRNLNTWRNTDNKTAFIKSPAIQGDYIRKFDWTPNKKLLLVKNYCSQFWEPSLINKWFKIKNWIEKNKKYYSNNKYVGYWIDEDTLLFEPNNWISEEIQTFSLSTTDSTKYYTYYNSSVKYSEETTKQAWYLSYSIKWNGTDSTRILINWKVVKSETTTTAQTWDLYIPSSTTVTIECVAWEGTATFNGIWVI